MKLTQGCFGSQFSRTSVESFEFLGCGQMNGGDIAHNGGWYNSFGEKLGFGDLDSTDLIAIWAALEHSNELFIVLSERDSFWEFVEKFGVIGSMCTTSPTEAAPGVDYVVEHARVIISGDKIYWPERIWSKWDNDPVHAVISRKEAKKLLKDRNEKLKKEHAS